MKKILLVTLLSALTVFAWSQPATVFLKNGSIIKGVIEKSADSLRVRIKSGPNLWVFSKDEILKIDKKNSTKKFDYNNVSQAVLLVGELPGIQLSTIHGITYKNRYSAGIGIAVDLYRDITVPLFIDLRADLLNSYRTPFIFGSVGPNFPLGNTYQYWGFETSKPINGLFWQAGTGIKVSKQYTSLMLTSAYSFSSYGFEVNGAWMLQPTTYMFYNRRILMGIAVGF